MIKTDNINRKDTNNTRFSGKPINSNTIPKKPIPKTINLIFLIFYPKSLLDNQ